MPSLLKSQVELITQQSITIAKEDDDVLKSQRNNPLYYDLIIKFINYGHDSAEYSAEI